MGVARLFQLSGIFAYLTGLWNKGVQIIEVLLYYNHEIHGINVTYLAGEEVKNGSEAYGKEIISTM